MTAVLNINGVNVNPFTNPDEIVKPTKSRKAKKPWKIETRYRKGFEPSWFRRLVRYEGRTYKWRVYGRYRTEKQAEQAYKTLLDLRARSPDHVYYGYYRNQDIRMVKD